MLKIISDLFQIMSEIIFGNEKQFIQAYHCLKSNLELHNVTY